MGIFQCYDLRFAKLGDGTADRFWRQAEVIGDVGTVHWQADQPVGAKRFTDPVEQQAEECRDLFAGEPSTKHQKMILQHADFVESGRHDHRMKRGIAIRSGQGIAAVCHDLGSGHGVTFRRMPTIARKADQIAGKTEGNHLSPTVLVKAGQAHDT